MDGPFHRRCRNGEKRNAKQVNQRGNSPVWTLPAGTGKKSPEQRAWILVQKFRTLDHSWLNEQIRLWREAGFRSDSGALVIPKASAIARLGGPQPETETTYSHALRTLMNYVTKAAPDFVNERAKNMQGGRTVLMPHTDRFLEELEDQVPGDFIVVGLNLGVDRVGSTAFQAINSIDKANEVALDDIAAAILAITDPELFQPDHLGLACVGTQRDDKLIPGEAFPYTPVWGRNAQGLRYTSCVSTNIPPQFAFPSYVRRPTLN